MADVFSADDLIATLMAARRDGEAGADAFTVIELAELTGMGSASIVRKLRKGIKAGEMECVRKPFVRIDGAVTTVPAYRMRKKQDEED